MPLLAQCPFWRCFSLASRHPRESTNPQLSFSLTFRSHPSSTTRSLSTSSSVYQGVDRLMTKSTSAPPWPSAPHTWPLAKLVEPPETRRRRAADATLQQHLFALWTTFTRGAETKKLSRWRTKLCVRWEKDEMKSGKWVNGLKGGWRWSSVKESEREK